MAVIMTQPPAKPAEDNWSSDKLAVASNQMESSWTGSESQEEPRVSYLRKTP